MVTATQKRFQLALPEFRRRPPSRAEREWSQLAARRQTGEREIISNGWISPRAAVGDKPRSGYATGKIKNTKLQEVKTRLRQLFA